MSAKEEPTDNGLLSHYSGVLHQLAHTRGMFDPSVPDNVAVNVGDVDAGDDATVVVGVPQVESVQPETLAAVETAIVDVAHLISQVARRLANDRPPPSAH